MLQRVLASHSMTLSSDMARCRGGLKNPACRGVRFHLRRDVLGVAGDAGVVDLGADVEHGRLVSSTPPPGWLAARRRRAPATASSSRRCPSHGRSSSADSRLRRRHRRCCGRRSTPRRSSARISTVPFLSTTDAHGVPVDVRRGLDDRRHELLDVGDRSKRGGGSGAGGGAARLQPAATARRAERATWCVALGRGDSTARSVPLGNRERRTASRG